MIASSKTLGGVKSSLFLSEHNHLFPIAISELNHLFLSFIGTKVILFTCWVDLSGVIIITVLLSRHVRTVSCPPGHLLPCCLVSLLDSDPVGCLLPASPHPLTAPHCRVLSTRPRNFPQRTILRHTGALWGLAFHPGLSHFPPKTECPDRSSQVAVWECFSPPDDMYCSPYNT